MNPDLREVLEALDDELPQPHEENSDNEDPEDLFSQLVMGGNVDNDDEYESDDTIRGNDITGSEYLAEMAKYKTTKNKDDVDSVAGFDTDSLAGGIETESMYSRVSNANTRTTSKQRRKRRQRLGGAYSEAGTDFSMTSSANFRNQGLTTLDDRFDKVALFQRLLI
jgi:protein LTV1